MTAAEPIDHSHYAQAAELLDVVSFAELVADISPKLAIDTVDGCLVATVGETALDLPVVEAETKPEPAPKVAPARAKAKRKPAAKRAKDAKAPAKARGVGQVAMSILAHLDADGDYDGGFAGLARVAYPTNPPSAQTELRKMEEAGLIHAERTNGRVRSVGITSKGVAMLNAAAPAKPEPTPTPRPLRPVESVVPTAVVPRVERGLVDEGMARKPLPVPAEGIKAPAGGWA